MVLDLKVQSMKGKGKTQAILGVSVFKVNNEFQFNFSTALDPRDCDIEVLKNFRNKFIEEIEKTNIILKHTEE